MRHYICSLIITASALTLAACGGGDSHVASTPPPPQSPTPTPSAPIAPAHIGLVSTAPFAVQAMGDTNTTDTTPLSPQNVQFSYDGSTNSYQISVPGFQPGTLANTGYSGSAGQVATGSVSQVTAGSSTTLQPLFVSLPVPGSSFSPLTYTSYGSWSGSNVFGLFAYGIPTAAGDVPTTGSASYSAQIHGVATGIPNFEVTGPVSLQFDFAGGQLNGSMDPEIVDGFDGIFVDFGHYAFTQTVYSTGSTTFSGKFIVPGLPSADSSFNGNFTGPSAAELMARFQAPYVLSGGGQGTLTGIWLGKKN